MQITSAATTPPPQFLPYVVYPTGSRAEAVAIGDLDGDGRKDVAVTTSVSGDAANDRMLNVFLQNADGTLKPRMQYPLGNGLPRSLDLGDVSGDGRADVVVGSSDGAESAILVLTQNPSGTLDAPVAYPTLAAEHVKVGDFNGDGRTDVAGLMAGTVGDGLDVFLQTAAGTLAAPVTYHVPHGGADELDAGDVTGDGRTDLVVTSKSPVLSLRDVSVLAQAADGTMAAPVERDVPDDSEFHKGAALTGTAIGDFTADGRNDILLSWAADQPGAALLPQGGQGLPPWGYAYALPGSASAIVVADLQGDGYGDVVQIHNNAPWLVLWRQSVGPTFSPYELYAIPTASAYRPESLAVGDINGDNLGDAAIANPTQGLVVLRRVSDAPPKVTLIAPVALAYLNTPMEIAWTASADAVSFQVWAWYDRGASRIPIPGCQNLPAGARGCTWASPNQARTGVQIILTATDAAGYTGSTQAIVDVVTPTLAVTMPSMTVNVGSTMPITWAGNLPASSTMRIEVSRNGGAFETIAAAAPNTGSYAWSATGSGAGPWSAQIRITSNGPAVASATSTSTLVILPGPTLTITSPTAGSTQFTGSSNVTWDSSVLLPATVNIEVSFDGGSSFVLVFSGLQSSTRGTAALPLWIPTTNARVRVTANVSGQAPLTATSSAFSVVAATLAVASPVAGSTSYAGTPLNIAWTTNLPPNTSARIELSRDGGASYSTLASAAPNTGSFAWTTVGPDSAAARVRVTGSVPGNNSSPVSTSGTFSILTPTLAVTNPTGGTTYIGTALAIGWSSNLPASSTMRVELSRDGGATFETLSDAAPNTGSFAWTVTGPAATSARIRITTNGPVILGATSASTFQILEQTTLAVASPAAGSTLFAGSTTVAWTSNVSLAATINVDVSVDGGATFVPVAIGFPSSTNGSTSVVLPAFDTANARVRVTAAVNGQPPVTAISGAFSIFAAALAVESPVAGGTSYAGTPLTIAWVTNLPPGATARIELSRDGGTTFETLADAAPNTGNFAWTTVGPDSAAARVRVTASVPGGSATGTSGSFSIVTPALSVTSPAGGTAYAGSTLAIGWSSTLPSSSTMRIELSRDGGTTFETLADAAPNTGSFAWVVAGPETTEAMVRVAATDPVAVAGISAPFAVTAPQLKVTAPGPGANWAIGTSQTVAWTSNLTGTVRVEVSRDGGSTFTTVATSAPATGSLAWTVIGPATASAVVRVSSNGAVPASGASSPFAIGTPAVTVTSPAAATNWTIGVPTTITWASNLSPAATVRIQLSRNGGSTFTNLTTSAPNSGSFAWTPTGAATTTALVRVTVTGTPTATGTSGAFTLAAATLTVTAPNTLVTWPVGAVRTIGWTHNLGAGADFKFELSRDGGTSWSVLAASMPSSGTSAGSYDWTITGPASTKARVRVTSNGATTVTDKSDVNFKIQ